jgi:RNA 2',3'-cyclic 3'-phosphodiesterase
MLVRLFFAAFPTPEIRLGLASAAAALGLCREARLVPVENYHMTIAFAGEVSREQAAALRAAGAAVRCPSFEVTFDAYEYWQKPEVAVAVASDCPAALLELHHALHAHFDRLGLPADSSAFRAHVTLARKVTQAPVAKAMSRLSLAVRDFELIHSGRSAEGSIYTVVDRWPLLDNAGRGA